MDAWNPRRLSLALAGVAIGLLGASAAAGQTLRPLEFSEVERFQEERPVTGTGLWGVIAADSLARVDLAALRVAIPPPGFAYLCLEVQTRDGRYRGEARYGLPARAGLRTVEFPTRHTARLSDYLARDLGVRAFAADDCELSSEDERTWVPVYWAAGAGAAGHYIVLLNAIDERTTLRLYHQEEDRYFECAAIESDTGDSFVFDTRCELVVAPGTHLATLTLIRTRLGQQEQSDLTFYFP